MLCGDKMALYFPRKTFQNCKIFKLVSPKLTCRRFTVTSVFSSCKNVQIICNPLSGKMDEKVAINIQGLARNQKITLLAKLVGDAGDRYHSIAHYISDEKGQVYVSKQPSVGGFYQGVEPMGFLWSLKAEPGQKPGRRLLKRDVTKPYLVDLEVLDGHVNIQDVMKCSALCRLTIERYYMSAGVRRIAIREGRIRGSLFLPPGEGPFQGVIDLIGSHGGLVEFRAALLASHGFAALALAYINYDDLPTNLEKLELEYFIESVQWLKNHPSITPGGVGIMGISKGAEIALLTASHCRDIKACVFNGGTHSLCLVPMFHVGKLLPHIPLIGSEIVKADNGSLIMTDCYPDDWNGATHENPKGTPVENTDASLLLIYGTNDHAVDVKKSASLIYNRLKAFGKESQCTVLGYHGAGHLIEPPYAPLFAEGYQKSFGLLLAFGGEPKQHSVAQEHAWRRILQFFKEHLP